MLHARGTNNRLNRLHERSLRIVYDNYTSDFDSLLELDKSVNIHQRNLQILATLLYKIKNNIATEIIQEMFST